MQHLLTRFDFILMCVLFFCSVIIIIIIIFKAGVHSKAVMNDPSAYEVINPSDFGVERSVSCLYIYRNDFPNYF